MATFLKFIVLFLILAAAAALASGFLGIDFGRADYWDHHGVFLLLGLTVFPRLTLLLSSIPTGGLLWWLGWIFSPRILVAVLATLGYWNQNPVLVTLAWMVAVGGESSEKVVVARRVRRGRGFDEAKWVKTEKVS